MMDREDFDNEEDYWALLCEHQDLCRQCYAPWHEHGEDREGENTVCPE
jgi:hypothetical protein